MGEYKTVIYEKEDVAEGSIAKITLNRPERLNTWGGGMMEDFHAALEEAAQDDDVKVVIMKGAGRCFSAGFDLTAVGDTGWFTTKPGESRPNQRRKIRGLTQGYTNDMNLLLLHPKMTICQLHGIAVGQGEVTMMCCDMCVAAESARLGEMEQHLGHGGQIHHMALLMMAVGPKKAVELLVTGRPITAKEAARIGLINYAVPDDKLEEETMKLAKACCLMPADSIAIGKAARHIMYERMGLLQPFYGFVLGHALDTSMSLRPGEFRFLHAVKEKGMRGAIHEREARFDGLFDVPAVKLR